MGRTKNLQFLRISNRASIIKALALGYASSRIELATHLGLSKMAISTLVNDLIADGFIEEKKRGPLTAPFYSEETSGKKPTTIAIPHKKINALSIYIKRYEVHCVITEIQGNILYHDFALIPKGSDNTYLSNILIHLMDKALNEHKDYHFAGIGVASVGPLDIQKKRILYPPEFYNIGNFDIGELLENRYHQPVFLDNDMNASAMAEQFYGVGKSVDSIVYVGFGTGVGAGIIIDGKLLHGSGGFAGEIGHISIDPNGPLCDCGQHGCAHEYTTISTLLQDIPPTSINELWGQFQDGLLDDKVYNRIASCQYALKTMLLAIANLFDPQVIVFGEVPPKLYPIFLAGMETYMNEHMFHHGFQKIQLYPSSFGENTPLIGSAALVFQRVFDGKLPLTES